MRASLALLLLWGCVNSQHAEVRLANNPAGADCFARCVQSTQGLASVDCVAACPGAVRDSGDCGGGLACVEDRKMSKGKTALLVIAAVVVVAIVAPASGSR
ncbi:MAG TPA: hypothetical protein VLB44_18050 [Kofleriaceae bacterium]|nr:hypothetical protein [Kofleriaceae bacterium]